MLRALAVLAAIALTVYALADCAQSEARHVRTLPRGAWLVVILVLPVLGPLLWIALGRPLAGGGPERGARPGPLAPDDDPDFLRRLDEQVRREKRERERGRGTEDDAG